MEFKCPAIVINIVFTTLIIAADISIYDGVEQSKYAHVTGMTIMRYDLST